jgi:hypothetical protein
VVHRFVAGRQRPEVLIRVPGAAHGRSR